MKKILFGLIATVFFGLSANAQTDCISLPNILKDKVSQPIKIYTGENSTLRKNSTVNDSNERKIVNYLVDFDKGILNSKSYTQLDLKKQHDLIMNSVSKNPTYLEMQKIIGNSTSPKNVVNNINKYLENPKISLEERNQFIVWSYSIQILESNGVFNNLNFRNVTSVGPCWAGIVGGAGAGALAGAGIAGVPSAGLGAGAGAVIGGICGALIGWSQCD
jgi:hypothetical protein